MVLGPVIALLPVRYPMARSLPLQDGTPDTVAISAPTAEFPMTGTVAVFDPARGRLLYETHCGACHDRDVNAAKNILAVGKTVIARGERVSPQVAKATKGNARRSVNLPALGVA